MNKEEALKQFKSMFPEDIEAVVLTKESYDNYLGIKEYENIQLKQKIEELEEEIIDLRADYGTKVQIERDLFQDAYLEKKEIIDKAIEYIENKSLYKEVVDYDYEENPIYVGANDEEAREDLLEILKGEE